MKTALIALLFIAVLGLAVAVAALDGPPIVIPPTDATPTLWKCHEIAPPDCEALDCAPEAKPC